MPLIKVMNNELANLIRAGEIVYRPSYIVKELVENSIDAHSKNIKILIKSDQLIEITCIDDGDGMDREDAILCFKNHSSSKVTNEYDLSHIKTLGFRGEALASISSVCHVKLRTSNGIVGTKVDISPNKEISVSDDILRKGSTFEISEIFFNTPARFKYQNSIKNELLYIVEMLQKVSLGYPNISISLFINGKCKFKTTGRNDLKECILNIYGNYVSEKIFPININTQSYKIYGFSSFPELYYSSNRNILIYVNDRSIYSLKIINCIKDSYKDYIPPLKYPLSIIKISTDPSLVDVNCDPTKRTVKLQSQYNIELSIKEYLNEFLKKIKPIHTISMPDLSNNNDNQNFIFQDSGFQYDYSSTSKANVFERDKNVEITDESFQSENSVNKYNYDANPFDNISFSGLLPSMHPVGQILNTYIICESLDSIYLIDQHAAAERINYEKLEMCFETDKERNVLLNPIIIELTPKEYMNFDQEHKLMLENVNIISEDFGLNSIKITEIPSFIYKMKIESILEELIHSYLNDEQNDPLELLHLSISNMACKMSIKANKNLSLSEMEQLVKDLAKCKNPSNCPHGRPTIIKLSISDLERMFKRSGI